MSSRAASSGFTSVAEDGEGHPLLEALTTATFAEHGSETKLTVEASAVGLVAESARMLEGMEQGWSQSPGRLADLMIRLNGNSADREITATRVISDAGTYPETSIGKS